MYPFGRDAKGVAAFVKPRFLLLFAVLMSATIGAPETVFSKSLAGSAVIVRALDKVTARVLDLEIPIDGTIKYGTLEITARKCLKTPPEETPETSTFLEIREMKQDEEPLMIFNGWMFASSPALNALEHPVYDVWVIDCKMEDAGKS